MTENDYPSTNYILSRFSLFHRLGKAAPDWATGRLIAGDDMPSLRILAGMSGDEFACEIEDYFLRTLKEMKLVLPVKDKALLSYVQEICRLYQNSRLSLKDFIDRIMEIHYQDETHLTSQLNHLAWVWSEDFRYNEDITADNFDWELRREIDKIIAMKNIV